MKGRFKNDGLHLCTMRVRCKTRRFTASYIKEVKVGPSKTQLSQYQV